MTTKTEMDRKVVLALWDAGMEGTCTGRGEIRVVNSDGSEFEITIKQTRN